MLNRPCNQNDTTGDMYTNSTDGPFERAQLFRYVLSWLRTRAYEAFVFFVSIAAGAVIVLYLHWNPKPTSVRRLLRFLSCGYIYGAKYIHGINYKIEGLEDIPSGEVI